MSEGHRMPLGAARKLAESVVAELLPGCQRIAVAGSIRRAKPTIGDLEVVAIPTPALDLFGGPTGGTMLDPILGQLVAAGRLERVKGGEKYRQYVLPRHGCKLDLFLASPETWPCVLVIRTGSAEFSHRLVTPKAHGGLCPSDMKFSEGRLWRDGQPLPLADERDLFAALGLDWIEPQARA